MTLLMKQLHGVEMSLLSCQLCNLDFGAFWIRDVQPAKNLKNKQTCILPNDSRCHSYWEAITSSSVLCAWILQNVFALCPPPPQFFSHSPRNVWLGKPQISPASSPYEPKLPVWASRGLLCKLNVTGGSLQYTARILELWAHRHCSLSLVSAVVCLVFTSDSRLGLSPPKPFPAAYQ